MFFQIFHFTFLVFFCKYGVMKLLIFLAFISVFSLSSCAFWGKESSPRSLFRIEGKLGEKNRV